MAAEELTEAVEGGLIGGGSADTGTGLVFGVYSATSTENGDWVVLGEFTAIKAVVCQTVTTGAYATEAVTIDATTTNKVIFTAGSTDAINLLVWGTPA